MHVQALTVAGVFLLGAMSPGPDFVVVLRSVLTGGRGAGMAAAAGIATGLLGWAVVTSVGVAGLLAASAVAFTVVKLLGAAYLVFLGVQALVSARRGDHRALDTGTATSRRGAFAAGALTNLLNPKVAVFFLALWPQFLPAHATLLDVAVMTGAAAGAALVWFLVVANVATALRRFLVAVTVRRALDAVMGTVLVAIGVRIALSD
ncbi:LysE family translocator [Actinophytocola oryzae]|uniref:Threonine/homoserine/homoserine lactone efflux protein n=1 Tax=Actinophytocola oryzae TaxID=502181 RepID=A0A4R7VNK8_9PSEU|nr:LysE family translocator [Actinophytocola oryzae]TDV50945.1 threonine/homoserine/homoserine lactone efflux protein [Actinophytocola oryzae]